MTNYSANARLLQEEEIDFDTVNSNETGINEDRMRLPERYDIAKFYKRFKQPSSYDDEGNPRYEKGRWTKKSADYVRKMLQSDDYEWQITYSFPSTVRNPYTSSGQQYGGKNVTFRRLYLILCEHFNEQSFFIDDYFDEVYPVTIKPEMDKSLESLKSMFLEEAERGFDEVNQENIEEGLKETKVTKEGTLNKSASRINRRANDFLSAFSVEADKWEETEGEYFAERIKDDIINTVMDGRLFSQQTLNSMETMLKREQAGLSAVPRFFAIGRLIESIQLYVDIRRRDGKWMTRQGILV